VIASNGAELEASVFTQRKRAGRSAHRRLIHSKRG
jgi:hypothetical protein